MNEDTLYARILSGDLTPEELSLLKTSGEWEEIQNILNFSSGLSLPKMDVDKSYQKLSAKNDSSSTKASVFARLKIPMSIAASLVFLIGIFLSWSPSSVITAKLGTVHTEKLIDGSMSHLNSGSEISYKAESWGEKRELELAGEAMFNVKKGTPFIIHTENAKVEVLGTSFNVKDRDGIVQVNCYTGKVRVSNSKNVEIVLTAGEGVKIFKDSSHERITFMAKNPEWMNGKSAFKNESIRSVLNELERKFGVKVNSTSNQRITGSFTHENLRNAMSQVCVPLGLKFEFSSDHKTITVYE